jgi:phospholipid-binding lipoprotein MlaA
MRRAERGIAWVGMGALAALVSGCATGPHDVAMPINDPNEHWNRQVLAVNQAVLRPVATVVKAVTPEPIHGRLHDLDANLREPRIFANDILQLRFDAALKTSGRFIANSTFGIGGLFDVASQAGLPQQSGDFGQTLFVYGVGAGPYSVAPYFGPSTLRDSIGSTVDMIGNPVGWVLSARFGLAATLATTSLGAAANLSQLKQAEDSSIDFYSFLRSAYYQNRRAELREAIGLPNVVESPASPPAH